jgi:hypothetical protein
VAGRKLTGDGLGRAQRQETRLEHLTSSPPEVQREAGLAGGLAGAGVDVHDHLADRARPRLLLHRQQLSPQTIDRMVSYFARHEVDKQGSSWETYGKGRQAWDGWGGDPGRRWATAVARRMDAAEQAAQRSTQQPRRR